MVGRVFSSAEAFPTERAREQRVNGRASDNAHNRDYAQGQNLAFVAEEHQPVERVCHRRDKAHSLGPAGVRG